MIFMSVKNQFSKHANEYNDFNIIQQIAAKALVRDIKTRPKKILEIGCGSGQVFKYISWQIEKYHAVDFSSSMCSLHPKNDKIDISCYDFDSLDFRNFLKNQNFDIVISSSAMQWSKDLSKLIKSLSATTSCINAVLFTSNTFKTIQKITGKKSPILSTEGTVIILLFSSADLTSSKNMEAFLVAPLGLFNPNIPPVKSFFIRSI